MLEKTIKSVICKKINDWISSVKDVSIQKIIKKNTVVTGGCFTSLMQNEMPKDYDIYFKTKESAIEVAEYYVKEFNEHNKDLVNKIGNPIKAFVLHTDKVVINEGRITIKDKELADYLGNTEFSCNPQEEEVTNENFRDMIRMIANLTKDRIKIFISSDGVAGQLEDNNINDIEIGADPVDVISEADEIPANVLDSNKEKYRPVFLSSNAITLSDDVQIVIRFYGEPNEIHDTYDFAHTKAYWVSWLTGPSSMFISKEVYECVMNKTLIYTGSKYPLCSIIRMRKFIKRGWTINAGQILKMCMQVSDLDLHNIDVLEDALVGVDSLYFCHLIKQFREAQEKDSKWTYDTNYVISVIDRIF